MHGEQYISSRWAQTSFLIIIMHLIWVVHYLATHQTRHNSQLHLILYRVSDERVCPAAAASVPSHLLLVQLYC